MNENWVTRNWTSGELNALVKKLGEKTARRLLTGELTLKLGDDGATVELVKAVRKIFDRHGRRIPQDLAAAVCDANRDFHFIQPKLDYVERYRRYFELFGDPGMIADEFCAQSNVLIAELKADASLANLLLGVHLPIILPQISESFDYGKLLQERFFFAVETAYRKEFPNRNYRDLRKGELKGKVKSVHPSHDRLIAELKTGPRVGLYFPNPLQGFSIDAGREQMTDLPESLHLAGGVDTSVGMAMYPDVLTRDEYTPGLNMAALSWGSSNFSLYFAVEDDCLGISGTENESDSFTDSAGLLFLG